MAGFDGLGGSRSQGGFGGRGRDYDGPSKQTKKQTKTIANEKKNAMAKTTSTASKSSLSPGQATAMFGQKLGAQISGIKGITAEAGSNLAQRMNIGQLKMQVDSSIDSDIGKMLAYGPLAAALDTLGKFSVKNVLNEIIAGTGKMVYNDNGQITGVAKDGRMIAGYGLERPGPQGDGPSKGTFTSAKSTEVGKESSVNTSVDSGSKASLIPVSKVGGTPDSSGSGRRSMFGRKVR